MPTLKIFLVGLPQSGKTEFIKSVSDLPLVSVQKKMVRTEELVDMDYGRVHLEKNMIYLYAPVDDIRYSFLWESLHAEMHGFILLVSSLEPENIRKSISLYKSLTSISNSLHITVFTKTDLVEVPDSRQVDTSQFGKPHTVSSCICTRKASVRKVVQAWLNLYRDQFSPDV